MADRHAARKLRQPSHAAAARSPLGSIARPPTLARVSPSFSRVIDLHSHLLPGLDDGARNLDESLAMALSMVADGVTIVAATPHVRDDHPTEPGAMEDALEAVRATVADAGLALDVLGGGEVALDRLHELDFDARSRFGLGGNASVLLLEFPYHGLPIGLAHECARLSLEGVVPVIAHPERNPNVQERPGALEPVVCAGGVIQLTAASVDGRLGRAPAACARRLLELELAHLIASDAHSPGVREAGMSAAANSIGGELGHWLTTQVPTALLAGDELPPRPGFAQRRLLRRRRRS